MTLQNYYCSYLCFFICLSSTYGTSLSQLEAWSNCCWWCVTISSCAVLKSMNNRCVDTSSVLYMHTTSSTKTMKLTKEFIISCLWFQCLKPVIPLPPYSVGHVYGTHLLTNGNASQVIKRNIILHFFNHSITFFAVGISFGCSWCLFCGVEMHRVHHLHWNCHTLYHHQT